MGSVLPFVAQKFKKFYDVVTNDLDETKSTSTLPNLVHICDTIFLCLPTPATVRAVLSLIERQATKSFLPVQLILNIETSNGVL